ncbi:hypothetical protein JHK86_049255 [Glycine max]|nr:hypothetical protein JHK86_049255 [Glycine max]
MLADEPMFKFSECARVASSEILVGVETINGCIREVLFPLLNEWCVPGFLFRLSNDTDVVSVAALFLLSLLALYIAKSISNAHSSTSMFFLGCCLTCTTEVCV